MHKSIQSLTPMRGLAALLVVVHHFNVVLLPRFGDQIARHTHFFENGYLAVDFFFILSGFILTHIYANNFASGVRLREYANFLASRFARIYPLHIVMLMAFLVLELANLWAFRHGMNFGFEDTTNPAAPFTGSRSLIFFIKNIFLVHSLTISSMATSWNHPAWSIGTDWVAYLFAPGLIYAILRTHGQRKINGAVLALTAFGCMVALFAMSKFSPLQLDLAGFLGLGRCLAEFTLGSLAYTLFERRKVARVFSEENLLVGVLVLLGLVMHFNLHDILAIPLLTALILSAASAKGAITRALNSRPLQWLGETSYALYMVHIFVSTLATGIWGHIFRSPFGANFSVQEEIVGMVTCTLVSLGLAWLAHRLVEKPLRNMTRDTLMAMLGRFTARTRHMYNPYNRAPHTFHMP